MVHYHILQPHLRRPIYVVNNLNNGFRCVLEEIVSTHVTLFLLDKRDGYGGRVIMPLDQIAYFYSEDPETTTRYMEYLMTKEDPCYIDVKAE